MLRVLLTIGIGGPVFGGLFAWYGLKERDIAKESSPIPETMTLSQLIARGPQGNANVIVTDFVTIADHAVERGRRGRWSGAWVPIVPKDPGPAGGSPRALKVLIYCDGSSSPEGVYQRVSTPQLAGLVINKIKTPKSSVEDHFKGSYPQTDFSTCIYIQEGREPSSETTASIMIFGGIAGVVIGLGCLVLALFVWQKNKAKEAQQKTGRKKRRFRDDDDEDEDEPPRKRRSSAKDVDDEDRPRKRRVADGDEEESPRKKRRPSDDEDDERPSRRRSVSRDDADDRPRKRRPLDDDEDERPRRRRSRDDD